MAAFVALLRGINVGRNHRIPMAALRELLARLGYAQVTTLLNSGNAIFHADPDVGARAAAAIGRALDEEFGFSVPVMVKPADEFEDVASAPQIGAPADPAKLLVVFSACREALDELSVLHSLLGPSESLCITSHAAYLHCAAGILESKAAATLSGGLGRKFTTRNLATVLKIAAALKDPHSER